MITCATCGTTNQDHHRFCLGCGARLNRTPDPAPEVPEALAGVLPAVPAQTPREMSTGWGPVLKAHTFGLMFGGIWALVGGLLVSVFTVIGLLAMPLMLLFGLLPLLFFVIGAAILLYALRGASRDRDLMLHGTRVVGEVVDSRLDSTVRVNQKSSTRIDYTYRALQGREHSGYERLFDDQLIRALPPGAEVPILFSPSDPSSSVLPAARDVRFVAPAPVEDNRPERLATQAAPPPSEGWSGALPLVSSLDPAPLSVLERLMGASDGVVPMGALALDGARLSERGPGAGATVASVDLEEPFVASITVWPLALGQVEVAVSLRNRGAPATEPSITVKSRLAQEQVSGHLPVQQEAGAWLKPADFERLWGHLCYHASLHGDDLRRDLQTRGQQARVPAQEAAPATRRA
ncbi:MAG: hypothetical protein CMH57_13105 [Myxococcales bacterium]|nr:hypothetical protein [Myxococcales bacterium]